ncbi:glycosyltransferase [Actinoplanes sp. N902-109]|uniref:glycosyltransferase n=1 Tax=Actinoplanes sp. (strain N902-109) TaxID=649831 RepID=UPI0007C5AEC6|nr:glycosyltransferase [Actinoplanes sp. N902-109]
MNRVVVWRSALLPASETFVRAQSRALSRWQACFAGAFRVASPLAADDDVIVFPPGFLWLRVTGRSPRLRRALRGLRPDLVHAHFGGDGWLISASAAALGVPLIVTLHGHDVTRQPYATGVRGLRARRNLRTVFRRAAAIIAVSGPVRDRALALGADPAKVRVHHTGVPIPAARPVPKRWDLVFVGRLVAKKGLDDLIAALGTLRDLAPRVLIVGDGPLRGTLTAQARSLGVPVTFAGALDHAAAGRAMAEAEVFVSPSRTSADGDAEGLPTTLLEAMALGVPVVSTRHSGIPEAVVHGETGLLGAEGDRVALAGHLRLLLTDDTLRQRMGRRAREHAMTTFDIGTQTARLEDLYDAVLAAAPAQSRPDRRHRARPGPPIRSSSRR